MELIFGSESTLVKIALTNFLMLALSQFIVFPLLGSIIHNRCKKLGYEMKSQLAFVIFNTSGLWSEAREFNRKANDKVIKKALRVYRYYWGYAMLSFIFVVLSFVYSD